MRAGVWCVGVAAAVLASASASRAAIDEAHAAKARAMADKAAAYLRAQQDKESGGWSVPPAGSTAMHMPAITGLVLTGLAMDPKVKANDPTLMAGVKYLLNWLQPDGGIYDRILPSYNTSIALSALAKIDLPVAKGAIPGLQEFLRQQQWSEKAVPTVGGKEAAHPVEKDHPFYGGVGYGNHGRPDLSNLEFMLQAMHDSGVSADDASFQRALTFLHRTQMLGTVNDMPYAAGTKQGGFIYSTVENAESVDGRAGQSMAGTIEETLDDGTKVSRLRCYGSMTYSGFKSYLYANLGHDDARVKAALGWIQSHYTLEENPGLGPNGLYYYLVTFARGLHAWSGGGEAKIEVVKADGTKEQRDWANDLIDRLAELQNEDGSFKSVDARWMENNPVLITAYGLMALREATHR